MERLELRRVPPGPPGEGGWLSSGVLAGGVGMQMMAAVKSEVSQFSFKLSWVLAFRLERLGRKWGRDRKRKQL